MDKSYTEESSTFTTIEKENEQLFKKLIPSNIRIAVESEEEKKLKGKTKEKSRRIKTKQSLKERVGIKKTIQYPVNIIEIGKKKILDSRNINTPLTLKAPTENMTPVRATKHCDVWDELNKSINEMKQKISERLSSARKVNVSQLGTERKIKKVRSVNKFARSPYVARPMLANYNEKKKNIQRSVSRKRLCENCFKLMSKGFSLVNCSCRKIKHK